MTPTEYKRWYDFRKKVRALEKEYDYDGSGIKEKYGRKGPIHWGVKAMRRYANGYLAEPNNKLYSMPSDEMMKEYFKNPKEHLSASDKKLWSQIVGKRKK